MPRKRPARELPEERVDLSEPAPARVDDALPPDLGEGPVDDDEA